MQDLSDQVQPVHVRILMTMKPRRNAIAASVAGIMLSGTVGIADVVDDAPVEHRAFVDDAIPGERHDADRTLLVYTGCRGYVHASIPIGAYALTRLGEVSGAWQTVVRDDPEAFRDLTPYDGILLLSTTGTLFEDPALRENLVSFVVSGGGLIGIHAATDCFYDWPTFGALIGGYFDGHPWHEEVTIEVEEPSHPVAEALGDETFTIVDEIYQFRSPYSRRENRVLARLATWATDMQKSGIHRMDDDFAVSWVKRAGNGRVFYTSLGHRSDVYWNSTVLKHYRDGIRYALGDLPADATPSAVVHAATPEQAAAILRGWSADQGRGILRPVEQAIRDALLGTSEARLSMRDTLVGIATQTEVDPDARKFTAWQLRLFPGPATARALEQLEAHDGIGPTASKSLEWLRASEGYVTTWSVSGPHERDGVELDGLMRTRFAPESGSGAWKTLEPDAIDAPGIVNFGRLYGGTHRCAYLRTYIVSDSVRSVELRVGSDDGVRVWSNGNTKFLHDGPRAHGLQSDRFEVVLKPGPNQLLLKVTQGTGDWKASCRLIPLDSRGYEGLSFSPSP